MNEDFEIYKFQKTLEILINESKLSPKVKLMSIREFLPSLEMLVKTEIKKGQKEAQEQSKKVGANDGK